MGKIKGRGILVCSLLLLLGYAVYDYWHEDKTKTKQMEDARLLTLNFDQVDSLESVRGDEKLQLKRTVDGWTLEAPIKDLADSNEVESYIKSIATDRILEIAKEGDSIDWARFGLDKPAAVVTFKTTDGKIEVFTVSSMKNFENNPFMRRNQENRVLVVPGSWDGKSKKTVNDFQDRRFLRHRIASVRSFKLKNAQGSFTLEEKDGKWFSPEQKDWKLNQERVREMLQWISDAKARSFPTSPDDYNNGKVLFTLALDLEKVKWTAEVHQAKSLAIIAKVSDPAQLQVMEAGALDKFIKVKLEDLKEALPKPVQPVGTEPANESIKK
jgi:hypothetical protein